MSAKQALFNYYKKENEKLLRKQKPNNKNKQPEKEVVKSIVNWLKINNFDIHVIEAKNTYNSYAGAYVKGPVEPGYSDISGNDINGLACWIEVKAKGKRSNLSLVQKMFLERKINSNCFAVVVDCIEKLNEYYNTWIDFKKNRKHNEAKKYLLNLLPKKKKENYNNDELF